MSPRYAVIVTRDTTESVLIEVEAASAEEADAKALTYVAEADFVAWEQDDYIGEPYIGAPGEAEEMEDGVQS